MAPIMLSSKAIVLILFMLLGVWNNIAYIVRHKLRGREERVQKKTLDKNKTQVLFQQTAITNSTNILLLLKLFSTRKFFVRFHNHAVDILL